MTTKIHCAIEDGIARLRMDDGKANTIEETFVREFDRALDLAEAEAKAVLIEGRIGLFSGGLDLRVLPTMGREGLLRFVAAYQKCMLRLWALPKPVVSAVAGHAIAGGAIIAIASDRKFMVNGPFQIGLREVAIGIPMPTFGCELARHSLPASSIAGALFAGELYMPGDAQRIGMIDEVVEPEDLMPRALDAAKAMGALPERAFALTKARFRKPVREAVERASEGEVEELLSVFGAALG